MGIWDFVNDLKKLSEKYIQTANKKSTPGISTDDFEALTTELECAGAMIISHVISNI